MGNESFIGDGGIVVIVFILVLFALLILITIISWCCKLFYKYIWLKIFPKKSMLQIEFYNWAKLK